MPRSRTSITQSFAKQNISLPEDPIIPNESIGDTVEQTTIPSPDRELPPTGKMSTSSKIAPLGVLDKQATLNTLLSRNDSDYSAQCMTTVAIRASYNQILQTLSTSCKVPQKVILDNILALLLSQHSEMSILEQIRSKVMSNTKQLM